MKVAAAILAGGAGRRLGGIAKSFVNVGGRSIIRRQIDTLSSLFSRVVVVAGAQDVERFAPLGLSVLSDRVADAGPLAGIEAALADLRPDEDAVFCLGGDMPFPRADVLAFMRDEAPSAPALVPRVRGFPEPLFARYARACLPAIAARLAGGRFKTQGLFDTIDVTWVDEPRLRMFDPELTFLTNVNSPADLAHAVTIAFREDRNAK